MTTSERNKKYYIPPLLYVRKQRVPQLLAGSPTEEGTNSKGENPAGDSSVGDPELSKSSAFSFGYEDMN